MHSFDTAVKFVLAAEGGYANDSLDRGGPTNFGITWSELQAWCKKHPGFTNSVKDLTSHQAESIYFENYWVPAGCASLPPAVGLVHFDTAVNLGLAQAKLCLQRTKNSNERAWAYDYCADRMVVYAKIVVRHPTDVRFLKGWHNRVVAIKKVVDTIAPPAKPQRGSSL